jgi:glutamate mutase epsilon subunit
MTDPADGPPPSTVGGAIELALEAYATLTALGEDVEDEWTYVDDLSTAWRERLEAVGRANFDQPLPTEVGAGIRVAIDEIERIRDPHRAIDWLSTFPQVVLVMLGEPA